MSRDSSRNSKSPKGPYTGKIPSIKAKDYNSNLMAEIKKTQSSISKALNFESKN